MKFIKVTNAHTNYEFATNMEDFKYIERIVKVETGKEFTRIWLKSDEDPMEILERPEYLFPDLVMGTVPEMEEESDDE